MAKGPGRDQRGPMERLVRIAAVLAAAGPTGVHRDRLLRLAGFEGADPASQLSRELRHLTHQGWRIDNIAEPGEDAVYAMTTVDNRLRVRLTQGQQTQLRRAVLLADRDDLVRRLGLPDEARPKDVAASVASPSGSASSALSVVVRAVRHGAVVGFDYKGSRRVVHPESLRSQNGTWYLRGLEEAAVPAGGPVKRFVVDRMSAVEAGEPGSAAPVASVRHTGLHPMTWEVDPPVEVSLRAARVYEPDVRRWLGEPVATAAVAGADGGDDVVLTYRVTNRAALRSRLNELGRRVSIEGPEEVRREVVAALARIAGHRGVEEEVGR